MYTVQNLQPECRSNASSVKQNYEISPHTVCLIFCQFIHAKLENSLTKDAKKKYGRHGQKI